MDEECVWTNWTGFLVNMLLSFTLFYWSALQSRCEGWWENFEEQWWMEIEGWCKKCKRERAQSLNYWGWKFNFTFLLFFTRSGELTRKHPPWSEREVFSIWIDKLLSSHRYSFTLELCLQWIKSFSMEGLWWNLDKMGIILRLQSNF